MLIKDYERRLASHNTELEKSQHYLEQRKTYSRVDISIDRPPNPLSIFNTGLDKRLGNEIWVYYGHVPTLWDADRHSSENPFMNILSSIDIVFIFGGVLSLLALIFAYDALAGEYERGTLRLVLNAFRQSRTNLTCEIHQRYALFARADANECDPGDDPANDLPILFTQDV